MCMGLGYMRKNPHLAAPSASLALSGSETPRSCICTSYPEGLVGMQILHKYFLEQRAEQPARNGPMY